VHQSLEVNEYLVKAKSHQSRRVRHGRVRALQVESAGRRIIRGVLFKFSLFYEYSNLEYVHIHAICRVKQVEYGIRILVIAPQEYVDIRSTHRVRAKPRNNRTWR